MTTNIGNPVFETVGGDASNATVTYTPEGTTTTTNISLATLGQNVSKTATDSTSALTTAQTANATAATALTTANTANTTAAAALAVVNASTAKGNVGYTPLSNISANGATNIPIPASGNIYYVVTATAAAQLQFSGTPATGQQQTITLEIVAGGFVVTLPTTNVVPADSTLTLPTTATIETGYNTRISYSVRDGSSVIVGGV